VHDAVMRLVEGSCDLLIAYHHHSQPFQLDSDRYEMVSLGEETVAPYALADANGQPLFQLPGRARCCRCPTWAMRPGAYLGLMVETDSEGVARCHAPGPASMRPTWPKDSKAMALEGHGMAFLPQSAIRKELRAPQAGQRRAAQHCRALQAKLEIRAYRENPQRQGRPRRQRRQDRQECTPRRCGTHLRPGAKARRPRPTSDR